MKNWYEHSLEEQVDARRFAGKAPRPVSPFKCAVGVLVAILLSPLAVVGLCIRLGLDELDRWFE